MEGFLSIRYSLLTIRQTACFVSLSFAGLVVLARSLNPIPSRTRPLNSSAPMVLWLKPWESRSLPGLPRTKQFLFTCHDQKRRLLREAAFFCVRVTLARRSRRAGLFPPRLAVRLALSVGPSRGRLRPNQKTCPGF